MPAAGRAPPSDEDAAREAPASGAAAIMPHASGRIEAGSCDHEDVTQNVGR